MAEPSMSPEERRRLQLLIEHSADSILEVDSSLCVAWASPNTATLMGRPVESFLGRSVVELVLAEDRAVVGAVHRPAKPGETVVVRARANRVDREVWLEIVSRPVASIDGASGVATLRDVTAEVQAMAGRLQAEASLGTVLDNLTDFVVVANLDGSVRWTSRSMQEALGRTDFSPEAADPVNVDLAKGMAEEAVRSGFAEATMAIRDRSGRHRTVQWRATLVRDSDGQPDYVQAVGRDVTEEVRLREQYDAANRRFRLIADNATDIILRTALDGAIVWASPSLERVLGIHPDLVIGRPCWALLTGEPEQIQVMRDDLTACHDVTDAEVHARTALGSSLWMSMRSGPFVEPDGSLSGRLITLRDAEQQVRSRQALQASEERFRRAMQDAPVGMAIASLSGRLLEVNAALADFLQRSEAELLQLTWQDFTHPDDLAAAAANAPLFASGEIQSFRAETRYLTPDGEVLWGLLSVSALRDSAGDMTGFVAQIADVSAQRAAREELAFRAAHDVLTGLPNRASVVEFIRRHLIDPASHAGSLAVMFCDLDNFKLINDALGHAAGDAVLMEVARRLTHSVRSSDLVSRLGGDEFVIAVPGIDGQAQAEAIAAKVLSSVSGSILVEDRLVETGISIGIALSDARATAEGLLQRADTALYVAKRNGRNRWALFEDSMDGAARRELSMASQLRTALGEQQLVVWYQPIMDMATGAPHSHEALVRWMHPERGVLLPAEFIPVAENSGLVIAVGERVMQLVADDLRSGLITTDVQVNISSTHVSDEQAMQRLSQFMSANADIAGRYVLEITETALPQLTRGTLAAMRALTEVGVRFAIDNFGTGFASITVLKDLPIASIKVDGALTQEVAHSPRLSALTSGILAMASALDLVAVAESVETSDQESALLKQGWRYAQGYLYGRPAPIAGVGGLSQDDRELQP